jgi:hypothetical protein
MLFRLHVLNGPLRGQQVTVGPEPLLVGQGLDCDLVIPDTELAARHAVFEHRETGLFVRDLGAMGRVLVNRREQRIARLKHGDVVELARTRLLVQAVVQTETPAPLQLKHQLQVARWLALLTLLCVVALVALLLPRHFLSRRPVRPAMLPVTNTVRVMTSVPVTNMVPVLMVVTSPPPTAELRKMHEELEIVREAMRLLAARTAAPPVVVTVTSAPPAAAVPPVATVPPTVVPPAAAPAEPVAAQPRVKIVSVEPQRLPAPAEFEDLRLLTITIAPVASNAPPLTAVSVKTDFFDEDEYSGRIAPTEALTPRAELRPEGGLGAGPITVTASYAVPAGLRDRQLLAGRKVRYAGYRIRVYAGGALQAEDIHPRWLLESRP